MPVQLKSCLNFIPFFVFTFTLLLTSTAVTAEQETVERAIIQPVTTLFELSFKLDSLGDLSEIAGIDLPPSGPVSLTANINVTEHGYALSDIRLIVGKSDISGNLSVSYIGDRPALTARLNSERIDLTELYVNEESTEDIEEGDSDENVIRDMEKVFSTDPLPFDFIRNVDVDLYYSAKTILSHELEMVNFEIDALQANGNLDIQTLSADVANGKLVASGSINAANAPPLISIKMDINKLEPGLIPDIRSLNAIEGLPTDITFAASGTGNSVADFMGTLNGNFLSQSAQGINYVTQINQLGINFLIKALNILNPFRKKQNESPINCIVVKFDIQDGEAISDSGIAAQTQNLNVIGGGIIDLKSEQFDFLLRPEARSGINIGTITLVDAVRISGRFSDPVVNAETQAALLKRAGTVGTVLLTGGLSLIAQKLFDKAQFKDDPCNEALQETAPATISSEKIKKPEDPVTK
jgi:AsmA family protein